MLFLLFIPAAYLLGSIPFGIVFAGLFNGPDPRTVGSGNIGATNVSRSAGKAAGALTLIADILKGALPTMLAYRAFPYFAESLPSLFLTLNINPGAIFVSLVGFSAFIGHLYPIFLKFRGGKGVATACGVMLAISIPATLLSAAVFVIVLLAKRYISLGSIVSAAMLPVFLSFFTSSKDYMVTGVAVAVLVIIKHKDNIKRIAEGTENKVF